MTKNQRDKPQLGILLPKYLQDLFQYIRSFKKIEIKID